MSSENNPARHPSGARSMESSQLADVRAGAFSTRAESSLHILPAGPDYFSTRQQAPAQRSE